VADAAAKMLAHWLAQDCGGDPLQLLQLLDVETYTGDNQHALQVKGAISEVAQMNLNGQLQQLCC
jgi:hypothetical protein